MEWKPRKKEFALSLESARNQVQDLVDHYDVDTSEMITGEHKAAAEAAIEKLLGYYRRGVFENARKEDGSFSVVFRPQRASGEITFEEIRGRHKIQMEKKREGNNSQKIYALMGSLSGEGEGVISSLRSVDISAVETLGLFFLCV